MASDYDVVVVGSGAAGGWAAKTLTEGGLQVAVLEAGPLLAPEAFAPRRLGASIIDRARATIVSGQFIQARSSGFNLATSHLYVNDREQPYSFPSRRPFVWIRGQQVGGRLFTWGRQAYRASDRFFKRRSLTGQGVDWPVSYANLEDWYDTVERFSGLYGNTDGLEEIPDGAYAGARHLTPQEERFKEVVEGRWPERRVVCGRIQARSASPVPSTLAAALETGRLHLLDRTRVQSVVVDEKGHARGVRVVDTRTGVRREITARAIALCASTLETVRILLCSEGNRGAALGNGSGLLGRCVMDNTKVVVTGPLASQNYVADWPPFDPLDLGNWVGFYMPSFSPLDQGAQFGICGLMGRGQPRWSMLSYGQMEPRLENHVTLAASKDRWGIPTIHIDCAHSRADERTLASQLSAVGEMAAAAGLRIGSPFQSWPEQLLYRGLQRLAGPRPGVFFPGNSIHELGGARMGESPDTSVVNRHNQLWEAPNVFVMDAACFPSCPYQNLTLTIQALAARAGDYIVRNIGSFS